MLSPISDKTPGQSVRKMLRKIVPSSDAELLSQFIDHADSEAFGELVNRYGPLIMGLARRHCDFTYVGILP